MRLNGENKTLNIFYIIVLSCLFGSCQKPCEKENLPAKGYFVTQTIVLTRHDDGIDGKLELLQDIRLKPRKQYSQREMGDSKDERDIFETALMRLIDKRCKVIDTVTVPDGYPWAKIVKTNLYGNGKATYIIVEDGRWSVFANMTGIIYHFAEIRNKKIKWITIIDPKTGKTRELYVASKLRDGWAIKNDRGGRKQIYWWHCEPADEIISYVRYRFDGKNWNGSEGKVKGYWDDSFEIEPNLGISFDDEMKVK